MPKYFASSRYRTFQKSLNVWGYTVLSSGKRRVRHTWVHPLFQREQRLLCLQMKRVVRSQANKALKAMESAEATSLADRRASSPGPTQESSSVQPHPAVGQPTSERVITPSLVESQSTIALSLLPNQR